MRQRTLLTLTFLAAAGGFLLGFWPLTFSGVVAMAFVGRGWFAPSAGLLFDLAYGVPVGPLEHFFFPFTFAALAVVLLRFWARRYILNKSSSDQLP